MQHVLCRFLVLLSRGSVVFLCWPAPEGKRSSGLTAVWVARNRFAVLDRNKAVSEEGGVVGGWGVGDGG